MPELPEVESVRVALEASLRGRRVESVRLPDERCAAHPAAEAFCDGLRGRAFSALGRRGKFLLCGSGRRREAGRPSAHDGAVAAGRGGRGELRRTRAAALSLDDGRELRFVDARRFGRLWLLRPGEEDTYTGMAGLGPEPDDPALDAAYLRGACGKSRRAVKSLPARPERGGRHRQHLFRRDPPRCAHPPRPARLLAERGGMGRGWPRHIPRVMRFFTEKNLVTFEEYRQSAGLEYRNTPWLRVYGHAGEACDICGTALERRVIGGRGSVFCPRCQV